MRRSGNLWLILMIPLFVIGAASIVQAQNAASVFGIDEPAIGAPNQGIVVKKSVGTSGPESYNDIAFARDVNKLLDEMDKAMAEMEKIVEETSRAAAAKEAQNISRSTGTPAKTTPSKISQTNVSEKSRTYTVVSGDTLWGIAQRFLGSGNRYWEIVEANKNRYPSLVKNPNLIYPDWKLVIPGTRGITTTPVSNPPPSTTPPSGSTDSAALNAWKGGKLSPSEFSRLLGPAARESMKRTGIPASVTLAQAALETGWGRATIGNAKNLFGIKGTGPAGSITVKTQEYVNGRYITVNGSFRKYNSWSESIDDHARLVSQGARYRSAMANKGNPDQFARELQKDGYATSPTYASTLISIMKSNNLYQWDK